MGTHQQKKLDDEALRAFRDRFALPLSDEDVAQLRFYNPGAASPEIKYLLERRKKLGGFLPARKMKADAIAVPALAAGARNQSTTMAFVQLLAALMKDEKLGPRVVPIVADEARTFGMQTLFRQFGIYSALGQLYEPEDHDELLYYREAKDGQILEEGITEAGALSSWLAAATAYSSHATPMLPFYIYYSVFGFQRVGDLIWAFGDQRGKGFLLGATAGRTTLAGEGLQHCDGHSPLLASVVPNCRVYDPAFAYEMAVIIRDGIERMYGPTQEDCFYYLTLYNENYPMPAMPEGVDDGIIKGLYRYREAPPVANPGGPRAQILASGTAMLAALDAQRLLAEEYDVAADVWSATSYKALREDALSVERWNRLHPTEPVRTAYVREQLGAVDGPIVAVTDFVKAVPDQIAPFVPRPFATLGTDGYGYSDTRVALRRHFEVDAPQVVVAVLHSLAATGAIKAEVVQEAIARFDIAADRPDPRTL
jgi:pyruvate dehydrogenase E1 component